MTRSNTFSNNDTKSRHGGTPSMHACANIPTYIPRVNSSLYVAGRETKNKGYNFHPEYPVDGYMVYQGRTISRNKTHKSKSCNPTDQSTP